MRGEGGKGVGNRREQEERQTLSGKVIAIHAAVASCRKPNIRTDNKSHTYD